MGKFNKTGKRGMPELNTSSLPDLIFTMLFFFMIVTKPLMQCNSHAIRFIYFCGRFITHKKIYEKGY